MKKSKSSKSVTGKDLNAERDPANFLIVGIGASAGGIQALKEFFENVPADSGVAYVVILHLSPDHESRLAEVLQTTAQIPVTQVNERVKVESNHVYVVPPNQHLEMNDGHIDVSPNVSVEARRAPVDIFFRTLAESHRARAISVVLSGTGADGSMGLKRVKERGGAAFVQNPREAEFSEMPRNSIATELVDAVLNAGEIPAKIVSYKANRGAIEIQENPESRPEGDTAALREIFTVLRVRTKHDFSNYKRPTILRRIERRINVNDLESLSAYAAFLRDNPNETHALLKDLLVSVTNFFRDKEAFETLEREVVPRILQDKLASDQIRVWVAGCATGEEAYSLAMMFAEQTENQPNAPAVQIFATDIDQTALAAAREGFYTINDAADVSPERLRRFFTKDGDGFRVLRELREMILFANHNLIKDPPFSHLDLVTCRNLLIYFNHAAQERTMETFHFALNPGGFLYIGSSESVDGSNDLYAAVSKEHRIFQSRQAKARLAYPVPEPPTPSFTFTAPEKQSPTVGTGGGETSHEQDKRPLERISFGDLHQQLLEQYAPPSIVVNENYDVVHLSDTAGKFLQVAGGEPSKNLLKMIRPELRLELRTALYQAVQNRVSVEAANLIVKTNGHSETVNLHVRPVFSDEDTARGFLLVLFEPSPDETGRQTARESVTTASEPIAQKLEEELERTKSQLRSSVEQYETQTEELRASNEELQAINEELRSSTEELETSREELQSINEEMITVNQELKIKIEELSQSNADFQNLMNSTDIGTIFLDRALRVKMFTPSVKGLFNLIEADLNRPLADISTKLDFEDLHTDVEQVLKTLQSVERELETENGKWYLMRIFPYRTPEDRINGVVVTFIDITRRVESEHELQNLMRSLEQQTRIFDTTLSGITDFAYIFDKDGRFAYSNPPLLDLLGITLDELKGKNFFDLNYPEELAARLQRQIQHVFDTKETVRDETPFTSPTGADGFYEYIFNPVVASDGAVESVAGSTRDITARKQLEARLAFLADFSQALIPLADETEIIRVFGEQINGLTNASVCALFRINEAKGEAEITAEWHAADSRGLDGLFSIPELVSSEFERLMAAGETVVVRDIAKDSRARGKEQLAAFGIGAFVNVPLVQRGQWTLVLGVYHAQPYDWRDDEITLLTEAANRIWTKIIAARAEASLRESEERLQQLIKNLPGGAAFIVDRDLRYLLAEGEALTEVGIRSEDLIGKTIFEALPKDSAARYEPLYRAALAGDAFADEHEEHGKTFVSRGTPLRSAGGEIYAALVVSYDISSRKRAEENLRGSEERFRAMFEQANVGIVQIDFDGRFLAVNPGFCKIIGYTEEELQKLSVSDITHPDDYKLEKAENQRLIAGEISGYALEERCFHKNGSIVWKMMTATLLRRESGEPFYILSIVEDITTRKLAEEALRESELQMRLVVEAAEMGTWEWNLKTGAVRWNDQHFRLFGREPENRVLSYKDFEQGVHPDDRQMVREQLEQAIEQHKVFQTEFRAVLPDGSTRWMSGYGRVVEHDQTGRAVRLTGVMFDATERKESEEAVRESKERLQLLIESATDYAIFTVTPDNIVDSWNAGAEKVFGYQEHEIIGESGAILFTAEDRANGVPEQEIKTAAATGRAEDERWHIRKDGSRFYASGVMRPLKDGAVKGFVKIARDMTENIRAEKAVRDKDTLQKLVGAQEDERKRIARDLHDHLGQQLTALRLKLSNARELCDRLPLCAEIDEIQRNAEQIDADVDFLAWELRPAALDDLGLVAALENYLKEWARHTGVPAEFYAPNLKHFRLAPETETNLYRIAQEALNNTYKHASATGASVMLERRGSLIVLIIEDDGAGFDFEDLQEEEDKGLGLLGMRERAALIGGNVQIETTPGKGTTIFVRIPVEEGAKGET